MNKYLIPFILFVIATVSASATEENNKDEAAIIVRGDDGKENRLFSEFLSYGLECFRNLLINGDEESGFPSFSSIPIGKFPIEYHDDILNLNISVTDFILYGLDDFVIKKVDFNLLGFIIDYELDFNVKSTGKYKGDLNLFNIVDVHGDGDIDINSVVTLLGHVKVGFTSTAGREWLVGIHDYHGFLLVKPDMHITGIDGDDYMSEVVSRQLSEIVEELVNANAEIASAKISPIILQMLQEWNADPSGTLLEYLINLASLHCPEVEELIKLLQVEFIKQNKN